MSSSTHVDNRVVNMQFNNAQFEAGVQQTIKSLDELKQSLNLNTSVTGLSTLQHAFNGFSLKNMEQSLESLTDRFSTMGIVGMTVIQNLTNSVTNFVKSKITSAYNQILTGGWGRASSIAQARFTLEGLFANEADGAEKVQAAMDAAKESVTDTAYTMASAAAVASQLAASNISSYDELNKTLTAIAGVASQTGDSFDNIGHIFTTVAGNGRLMGMQLTQLSMHGLNAAAILANSMGVTEAEVRDMVSKGQVSFQQFSDAMFEAFGKHAKDANKTFSGTMDNIKAQLSKIGEVFSTGIIENDNVIEFLNQVRKALGRLKDAIIPLGEPFTRLMTALSNLGSGVIKLFKASGVSEFIKLVGKGMDKLTEYINTFVALSDKFKESALVKGIEKVAESADKITSVSERQANIAKKIWEGPNAWGNGADREKILGIDYKYVQAYLNDYIAAGGDIEKMTIRVRDGSVKAADDTTEAMGNVAESAEIAADAFNPIDIILSSIMTFGKGIHSVFNSIKNVAKSVGNSFKKVFSIFDIAGDISFFGETFSKLAGYFEITDERAEKLTRAFSGLWAAIDIIKRVFKGIVTFMVDTFGPVLSTFLDIILTIAANIGDVIVGINKWEKETGIISSVFKILTTIISNVIKIITEFFTKLMQLPAVQRIKNALTGLAETIGNKLGPYLKDALEWVTAFFDKMNSSDGSVMESVLGGINSALEFMIDLFVTVKDKAVDFYNWIFGTGKSAEGAGGSIAKVGDGIEKIESTAEKVTNNNTFGKFFDKIGNGYDTVVGKIKGFAKNVVAFFKGIDYTKIAALGLSAAVGAVSLSLSKLMWNMGNLIKNITGIGGAIKYMFGQAGGLIQDIRKRKKTDSVVKVIKAIALAVAVLTASLIALTLVDQDKLKFSATVLGSILGALMVFTVVMAALNSKASKLEKTNTIIRDCALLIIAIGVSAIFLADAIKKLTDIKWNLNNFFGTIGSLIIAIGLLVAACIALSKWAPQMSKGGFGLILFAGSIYLIVLALKVLCSLNLNDVEDRIWILIGIMGMLSIFIAVAGQLKWHSALSVLGIIASIYLIELALWAIAYLGISWKQVKEHFSNFIIVIVALGIIVAALKSLAKANQDGALKGAASAVAKMALAMLVISLVVKMLGKMKWQDALQGVIAFTAVVLAFAFAVRILVSTVIGFKDVSGLGKVMIKLATAIALLAIVVAVMGLLSWKHIAKGLAVVVGIGLILGGLLAITSMAKNLDYKPIIAMIAVIAAMASVIIVLSTFVEKDVASILAAMGIIGLSLIAFTVSFAIASKEADKMDFKSLIAMVAMIAVLAVALIALAQFPILQLAAAAGVMSLVLLAMAESFNIFFKSFEKKGGGTSVATQQRRIMLMEMILAVAVIAAALSALVMVTGNNVKTLAAAALTIIGVIAVIAVSLAELNKSHDATKDPKASGLIQMGELLLGMIGIILALALLVSIVKNVGSLIAAAVAVGTLMLVLVGMVSYLNGINAKFDWSLLVGLGLMIASVVAIGYALKEVLDSGTDWTKMIAASLAIGIILAAIAGAMSILAMVTSSGTGTIAFLIAVVGVIATVAVLAVTLPKIASGIKAVAVALKYFQAVKIDFTIIIKMVVIFAALTIGAVVLGAALIVLAAGLLAVGVALTVAGVGAILIASAFWIFSKAMEGIAKAGKSMGNTLPKVATGIKKTGAAIKDAAIDIAKGIALAIISFAETIVDNKQTIFDAIDTVIQIIAKCVTSGLQLIVEIIVQKLTILFNALGDLAEPLIGALAKIFIALGEHAHEFGYYGALIIGGFFGGLFDAIEENQETIIDKITKLVITLGKIIWGVITGVLKELWGYIEKYGTQLEALIMDFFSGVDNATNKAALKATKQAYEQLLEKRQAYLDNGGKETDTEYQEETKVLMQMQNKIEQLERDSKTNYERVVEEQEKVAQRNIEENAANAAKNAKESLGIDATEEGKETGDSYFDGLGSKVDEWAGGFGVDSLFGSTKDDAGAAGEETADEFVKKVTNKIDASRIPNEVLNKMLASKEYKWSDDGKHIEKEISAGYQDAVQKATDGVLSQTDLYDQADEVISTLKEKGMQAGNWWLTGVKNGISSDAVIKEIQKNVISVGELIDTKFKLVLDENSPSKKGYKAGRWYFEGTNNGLISMSSVLANTVEDAGNNMVKTFGKTLEATYYNMDKMEYWTPTITPVVDTSSISQANLMLDGYLGLGNLSAQADLTFQNSSQAALVTQVQMLSEQVGKLADKDYSKMLEGVNFNIDASTNVDGKPLRQSAATYTIEQIDESQRGLTLAMGGRA